MYIYRRKERLYNYLHEEGEAMYIKHINSEEKKAKRRHNGEGKPMKNSKQYIVAAACILSDSNVIAVSAA